MTVTLMVTAKLMSLTEITKNHKQPSQNVKNFGRTRHSDIRELIRGRLVTSFTVADWGQVYFFFVPVGIWYSILIFDVCVWHAKVPLPVQVPEGVPVSVQICLHKHIGPAQSPSPTADQRTLQLRLMLHSSLTMSTGMPLCSFSITFFCTWDYVVCTMVINVTMPIFPESLKQSESRIPERL
jgi:hypothetical protein